MDAKVSHSCSDGVILTLENIMSYRQLRLQYAFQHKFCVIMRANLNGKKEKGTSARIHMPVSGRCRQPPHFRQSIFQV